MQQSKESLDYGLSTWRRLGLSDVAMSLNLDTYVHHDTSQEPAYFKVLDKGDMLSSAPAAKSCAGQQRGFV